jgi:hypothetical protein
MNTPNHCIKTDAAALVTFRVLVPRASAIELRLAMVAGMRRLC